jgi:hypothetical protein
MIDHTIAPLYDVDTPLLDPGFDEFDDYYIEWSSDPMQSIGRRMILILVVVPVVAFSLVFLARPASSETESIPQNNSADSPQTASNDVVESDNQDSVVTQVSNNKQIAPFFTSEVQHWEPKIIEWAELHGVDPNAVATIMQIESCGDPQAVSIAGARGLFQVMPFHFSDGEDMLDPDTNATRGLNFFNEQLRYTSGDIFLSFAGYNGGYAASGGAYENWANETQRYYGWARGIYEDAQAGLDNSETLNTWLAAGGAAGCERAAGRLNLN